MPPPPPLASLSLQGTTIVVDGSGSTPNAQPSITIAANMAVAGDTILVTPMTDSVSGLPVGYTETNIFSIPNGIESFPISIKQGVTIAGLGGQAHVYSTNLATPPELFKVGGGVVRIGNFQLLGSKTGIEVRGSTDLTVQKVTFANSTTGLDAELLGSGLMKVQVVDCLVTGQLPTLANPPASFPQSIGLKFHALEDQSGGIPRLEATVDNLTSVGPFTNMSGLPAINQLPTDLPFGNGGPGSTRLLEVFAQGETEEYPVFPGSPNPIAEVVLAVNGGAMDGGPDANHQGGWDLGIYAALGSTGPSTDNYTAGYSVTTTGAVFKRFRQAGIHGTANVATRGIVKLRGQTTVRGTGSGLAHNTSLYPIHNGVHMFCLEGYLALSADDSNFGENTGSGVFLSCAGSRAQDSPHPMGLFLGMRRCKIHLNGDTGLELFSGVLPPGAQYAAQAGIVGGTWTRFNGFAELTTGNPSASLPFSQGVVDRCSISNNGGHGIHVRAEGSASHYIFCRFTNNFIWNHPLEGFRSDVTSDGSGGNGIILTPIIQSTLAGNGDLVGASVEFEDQGVGISAAYSWVPPAGGNPAFGTEIDNTILQRKNPLDTDLGPNLDVVRGAPTSQLVGILASNFIGLGGLRFSETSALNGVKVGALVASTPSATPFIVGVPSWSSLVATQFFLDPLGANISDFEDNTPGYLHVPAPEVGHDFSGDTRTDSLPLGEYDKGAEELP